MAFRWIYLMILEMRITKLLGLLLLLLVTGCQTELKLAKQYREERPVIEAAVYFPEKAEVKVEYNTQYERKTEVLDGFSQDLFLDVMYGAYAEALQAYDVDVYQHFLGSAEACG